MFNSTPVPASGQESIQDLTLVGVPVEMLADMLTWFSSVKELKCHRICSWPKHKVQCVHMYSVACDALVFCTNLLPIFAPPTAAH